MARIALGLGGISDLSEASGISEDTIFRFELGARVQPASEQALSAWFPSQGVEFLAPSELNGWRAGVLVPTRIWRLEPVDVRHKDWAASACVRAVVVRAHGERRARQIASHAYGAAKKKVAAGGYAYNPWQNPGRVTVVEITTGGWIAQGPEAILDPAGDDGGWRRREE